MFFLFNTFAFPSILFLTHCSPLNRITQTFFVLSGFFTLLFFIHHELKWNCLKAIIDNTHTRTTFCINFFFNLSSLDTFYVLFFFYLVAESIAYK